jgi:beta-lactamase regulating signal transducer with metallopeptidase domain
MALEFDALMLLARTSIAGSAAIMTILLLRRPLRRFAGPSVAYHCWLVVAVALVAAALPPVQESASFVLALAPALAAPQLASSAAQIGTAWPAYVLLAWLLGMLASAAMLAQAQRRFVRSLGKLEQRDGLAYAASAVQGPALLGLWRPRIVLPRDFTQRYSETEQALIIAHEHCHLGRRDPLVNAILAALQCLFWFNPLIHIAASRCRFDQELACDAAVMLQHGAARQAYAAAMLKTQAGGAWALATCHWQASHPLKERIMQLKQTSPAATRRRTGHLIIALFGCAALLGTVAARAENTGGPYYDIALSFGAATPHVQVGAEKEFKVGSNEPGAKFVGTFRVVPEQDKTVVLKTSIKLESGETISPSLLLHLDEAGAIKVSAKPGQPAFKLGFTVKQVDHLDPQT